MIDQPSTDHEPTAAVAIALVLLVCALYWPVYGFDFINYDDKHLVSEHALIGEGFSSDSLVKAFGFDTPDWLPLTYLSWMIEHAAFGMKPGVFHTTNALIHMLNTLILFALLRRATGQLWPSALTAALFACHPHHVETVAWVSERKGLLSTLFGFLAVWSYVEFAQREKKGSGTIYAKHPSGRTGKWFLTPFSPWMAIATLFFAMSLMSKLMLITLPFVLLLMDVWPLKRREWMRQVLEKTSMFLISALGVFFLLKVHLNNPSTNSKIMSAGLDLRLSHVLVSYEQYIVSMFWPRRLAVAYPMPETYTLPRVLVALTLLVGVGAVAVWQVRRRSFLLMGYLWFGIVMSPVIGVVGVFIRSDRYTYVPMVGLYMIIAWLLLDRAGRHRNVGFVVASVIILALSMTTWMQVRVWRDSVSLWTYCTETIPDHATAHQQLGHAHSKNKNDRLSVFHYGQAVKLRPKHLVFRTNLANALWRTGDGADAIRHFRAALEISPGDFSATNNLAVALMETNQAVEAVKVFDNAPRFTDPAELSTITRNRGRALLLAGQPELSIDYLKEARRLRPDDVELVMMLGRAFVQMKSYDQAISAFDDARAMDDSADVRNQLGSVFARQGKLRDAIEQFRKALSIDANHQDARFNLGRAMKLLAAQAKE